MTSRSASAKVLIMLGTPIHDRQAERREATRAEIIAAAWAIAEEKGLAATKVVAGVVHLSNRMRRFASPPFGGEPWASWIYRLDLPWRRLRASSVSLCLMHIEQSPMELPVVRVDGHVFVDTC